MKSFLFTTSMALALASIAPGTASAQVPGGAPRGPAPTPVTDPFNRPFLQVPPSQPATSAPAPAQATAPGGAPASDGEVYQNGAVLPAPVDPGQVAPPAHLPAEPVGPYLLTKEAGPFMVLVHTFRGDYAVKQAQALVMELRTAHRMPAYVYFLKLKPGNSNVRGIPPTADRAIDQAYVGPPESERVIDEAAVLVGHCPTIDDADELRHVVKKLKPRSLADHNSIFPWRNGKALERAIITTNPLLSAQDLYPGRPGQGTTAMLPAGSVVDPEVLRGQFVPKADPLITRMNKGAPHSIYDCPAPYTLVVAEFNGRSTLSGDDDSKVAFPKLFNDSPLRTAHEDASKLADLLAKDEVVRSMGVQPYVYHDRTSSRVMLGAFQTPDDPKVDVVRRAAMTIEIETGRERDARGVTTITRKNLSPAGLVFEVPRAE